jgi:hypothetical protein
MNIQQREFFANPPAPAPSPSTVQFRQQSPSTPAPGSMRQDIINVAPAPNKSQESSEETVNRSAFSPLSTQIPSQIASVQLPYNITAPSIQSPVYPWINSSTLSKPLQTYIPTNPPFVTTNTPPVYPINLTYAPPTPDVSAVNIPLQQPSQESPRSASFVTTTPYRPTYPPTVFNSQPAPSEVKPTCVNSYFGGCLKDTINKYILLNSNKGEGIAFALLDDFDELYLMEGVELLDTNITTTYNGKPITKPFQIIEIIVPDGYTVGIRSTEKDTGKEVFSEVFNSKKKDVTSPKLMIDSSKYSSVKLFSAHV